MSEAILVLEDGRTFRGEAYGAVGTTVDCAQSWLRKIEPPESTSDNSAKKGVDAPLAHS